MTTQYEQDPVNGKFYPKQEPAPFTDEEWAEFQKRWEPKKAKKYSALDKFFFWYFGFAIFYMVAQWIRTLL